MSGAMDVLSSGLGLAGGIFSSVLGGVGGFFTGMFGKPKAPDVPSLLTTTASIESAAEAKAKADMELLRKQQRGAAATILSTTSQQKQGKSLLGE